MDSTPATTRKTQRKPLVLLLAVAGLLLAFDVLHLPAPSLRSLRVLRTSDDEPSSLFDKEKIHRPRPVIHTFFAKIAKGRSNTGMADQADKDLIEAWSSAWEAAGWDTRVLGVEDAEKHEDYARLFPLVDKLKLSDYDKLCYVRWIAMAAVGGGYMSDYDVLPLDGSYVDLGRPENFAVGKFKVYASTLWGTAVPALLSGTRTEWARMARALVEDGPSVIRSQLPSDMNVLMKLQGHLDIEVRSDVVRGQDVLHNGRELTKDECVRFHGKRGVHFSHRALIAGFARDDQPKMELRPEIIKNWMEMWKRVCMGSRIA